MYEKQIVKSKYNTSTLYSIHYTNNVNVKSNVNSSLMTSVK